MDIRSNTSRPQTQPLRLPATSPLPEIEQAQAPKKRGLFGHLGDVFIGGAQAVGDMAKGLWTLVRHPIKTAKGIGFIVGKLVTSPKEGLSMIGHAFADPYMQAIREGRPGLAIGRGIVEVGSLFVGPTEIANGLKSVKGVFMGSKDAAKAAQAASRAAQAMGSVQALEVGMLGVQHGVQAERAAALAAKIAADPTKVARYASNLERLSGKFAGRAAALEQAARVAGTADEASKLMVAAQNAALYAQQVERASQLARAGNIVASQTAFRLGPQAVQAIRPAVQAANELSKLGYTLEAAGRAGRAASVVTKANGMATGGTTIASKGVSVLPSAVELGQLASRTRVVSPFLLLTPAAAASIGRIEKLPTETVRELSPEKASEIAGRYGLNPNIENVRKFLAEAGTYPRTAVGPGAGTPDQVKQVQLALRVAGYDVTASGSFDEPTALAVIDFKRGMGISQGYLKADGQPAVNEYIDEKTAQALYELIQQVKTKEGMAAAKAAAPKQALEQAQDPAPVQADPQSIAERYGLLSEARNVEAFQKEIATYATEAVGPDSGSDEVGRIQRLLAGLGYSVAASGVFDDATAEAVMAFKREAGIAQSYRLADGEPAVNEWVDRQTEARMVMRLGGLDKA